MKRVLLQESLSSCPRLQKKLFTTWLFPGEQFAQVQRHTGDVVKEQLKKRALFPPEAHQVLEHGGFVQWTNWKAARQEVLNAQATFLPGPYLPPHKAGCEQSAS